jgi:hypothetical protein
MFFVIYAAGAALLEKGDFVAGNIELRGNRLAMKITKYCAIAGRVSFS